MAFHGKVKEWTTQHHAHIRQRLVIVNVIMPHTLTHCHTVKQLTLSSYIRRSSTGNERCPLHTHYNDNIFPAVRGAEQTRAECCVCFRRIHWLSPGWPCLTAPALKAWTQTPFRAKTPSKVTLSVKVGFSLP